MLSFSRRPPRCCCWITTTALFCLGVLFVFETGQAAAAADNDDDNNNGQQQQYCTLLGCDDRVWIPKLHFVQPSLVYWYSVDVMDSDDESLTTIMSTGQVRMMSDWTSVRTDDDYENPDFYYIYAFEDEHTVGLPMPSPTQFGLEATYYATTARQIQVRIGVVVDDDSVYDDQVIIASVTVSNIANSLECRRPNGDHCTPFCCTLWLSQWDFSRHHGYIDKDMAQMPQNTALMAIGWGLVLVVIGIGVAGLIACCVRCCCCSQKTTSTSRQEGQDTSSCAMDYYGMVSDNGGDDDSNTKHQLT